MYKRDKKRYAKPNLVDQLKVFNSGICYVYSAKERQLTKLKNKLSYSDESIGVGHYWEAYNNNISIDRAIGVPMVDFIDTQDVVKIDNEFYKIVQMQYKDNTNPKHWRITLQRSVIPYYENESN